jgi:hypothetical protein
MDDRSDNVIDFVKYKAEREMQEWMDEVAEVMRGMGINPRNPEFWHDIRDEDERDNSGGDDGTVRPTGGLCDDAETTGDEDTD